jgi:general secretion pathway protein J
MRVESSTARGFTLIEMLVAITILAIIALISWRGLDAVARSRAAVSGEIASQRSLQTVFAQLDGDLRFAARDPAANSRLPGLLIDTDTGSLIVLRQAPSVETGALRYQLVRYLVRDGALLRLTREVVTPAEIEQVLAAGDWPDAVVQVLARDVTELRLRVWTSQGWAQPTADNLTALTAATSLPRLMQMNNVGAAGVEVRVTQADGQQFVRALLLRG